MGGVADRPLPISGRTGATVVAGGASLPDVDDDGALIEIDGVARSFGRVAALDGVSVRIAARATGLLGANGAGKSTLMKVLLGLLRPDRGSVRVLGEDPSEGAWDLRRRMGYMPERGCLPRDMTARDLVVHMGELRGLDRRTAVLRASEVLFQVGLEEERSRLIGTFSTGMLQRTKLAQALVHSPELVVLDEPTNGLDPTGREEMLSMVRRLSEDLGIAVLISSHVLDDITRTCDAVVVMRAGTVAEAATMAQIDGRVRAGGLRVQVVGDSAALVGDLTARGVAAGMTSDGAIEVSGATPDRLADAVRDGAAATGVGLVLVRPAGPTLEDILVDALQ